MVTAASSPRVAPLDISAMHAPVVRLAVWLGAVTAASALVTWLFTREPMALVMGVGCLLWSGIGLAMINVGRESGPVMLASAALQVSIYAAITDVQAIHTYASMTVILTGVASILFLDKTVNLFLVIYSAFIVGVHLWWVGWTANALAEGGVSALAFLIGSVGLRWIWDRSMDSASRFLNLFERAPVSLWEEDFSKVGLWLDELRAAGVTDLHTFLIEDPAALREGMSRIERPGSNRLSRAGPNHGRRTHLHPRR
jgi:hypothetical protein